MYALMCVIMCVFVYRIRGPVNNIPRRSTNSEKLLGVNQKFRSQSAKVTDKCLRFHSNRCY